MRLGSNARAVKLASGKMLVVTDGAAHRRMRAAHSAWLSSSAVDRLRPDIESDIEKLLDDLLSGGGSFDAVNDFGTVIARQVLGRVLGVPDADWTHLGALTDAAYATNDEQKSGEAHGELLMYLYMLLERRRAKPAGRFCDCAGQDRRGRPSADRR